MRALRRHDSYKTAAKPERPTVAHCEANGCDILEGDEAHEDQVLGAIVCGDCFAEYVEERFPVVKVDG